MADITLKGTALHTNGALPTIGAAAPSFSLAGADGGTVALADFAGRKTVINVFPNIETGICQASVRRFNEEAAAQDGVAVINVSTDAVATLGGFCADEGIEHAHTGSAAGTSFGDDYGVTMVDGPIAGRLARAVFIVAADGTLSYAELVPEIVQHPDYDAALAAL